MDGRDENLESLAQMSNRYGGDPRYVLAGGGNTSWKNETELYVKPSGTSLATIRADGFAGVGRAGLDAILKRQYDPYDEAKREADVLADMMASRLPWSLDRRPSVETLLHNLCPGAFTAHLHPSLVNGLTCGADGPSRARGMFGDGVMWIEAYKPGYALASLYSRKLEERGSAGKPTPDVILLQNHGIFVTADSPGEIGSLLDGVMKTLDRNAPIKPRRDIVAIEPSRLAEAKKKIADATQKHVTVGVPTILHAANAGILEMMADENAFLPLSSPFTPDHVVYCKARFLYLESASETAGRYTRFVSENGYAPRVICVRNVGAFFIGQDERQARNAAELFQDAADIAAYSRNFGGPLHMTQELTDFIIHWEAESYRQKMV
ncbi:MAG: class II aldolase/adducin family protein [Synergistaceae bacterium]|jgi:rhamnose utilization protein RhaD (predicted bifunctional aldolase and dehydrogenase)|nr:class II aldolase/adducin family protein [Synergistaceae bacterium]